MHFGRRNAYVRSKLNKGKLNKNLKLKLDFCLKNI